MVLTWVTYVGIVLGVIGAGTGITGAIIAVKSHRRVEAIKALDLRIEVQRARNDAHIAAVYLVELFVKAIESRPKILSAIGKLGSGDMLRAQNQWDKDKPRIAELASQVPSTNVDYRQLGPYELEQILIELHMTKGWIDELTKRYEADLAWDADQVHQRAEDRRHSSSRFR